MHGKVVNLGGTDSTSYTRCTFDLDEYDLFVLQVLTASYSRVLTSTIITRMQIVTIEGASSRVHTATHAGEPNTYSANAYFVADGCCIKSQSMYDIVQLYGVKL